MSDITVFRFGPMEIKTRGDGLYYCSEKRLHKISALTPAERSAVRADAAKQARAAERMVNRLARPNTSLSAYDSAYHYYSVCDAISKAVQS